MRPSPKQGALGRRIAEERTKRGLSLRDLARLSDIPHSSLHDIESGASPSAPADRVARLARILRLSPLSLLSLAVSDAEARRSSPMEPVKTPITRQTPRKFQATRKVSGGRQ